MTTFLTDDSASQIRGLLKGTGLRRLAVAYWGKGAVEQLGLVKLTDRKNIRIICDLFSGACNPKEMTALLNLGYTFKTFDKLHSKVYCGSDAVIIGSSNASTNGLAFENAEFSGNVEANALIKDRKFVNSIKIWFDDLWENAATVVDGPLIAEAKPIWAANSKRTRQSSIGLLSAIRAQPKLAKTIKATVLFYPYFDGIPESFSAYQREGAKRYTEAQRRMNDDPNPYFQDHTGWEPIPNRIYFDFMGDRNTKKANFSGLWRTRSKQNMVIPAPSRAMPNNKIFLLDRALSLTGYRLSRADIKVMESAIHAYMAKDDRWAPPDDDGNYFEVPFYKFWTDVMAPYYATKPRDQKRNNFSPTLQER